MKEANCRLSMVFPEALEENIIDHLLEHPELACGFTTAKVEGHGQGAVYRSTNEQVRGRARRVKMEVVMNNEDAQELVAHLKEALPTREIAYWIRPVHEFGRFA
jgi:nitrogen regulatory protein PII